MEIRLAKRTELRKIARAIENKKISYNTAEMVKEDIKKNRLLVAVENNKILGQLAIVEEPEWGYTAIKRLCVYRKDNGGKGIASQLIKTACDMVKGPLGASPWTENTGCRKLFEKMGFKWQYTYLEKYNFYLRA